jgi:myosin heavy subunit
MKHPEKYFHRVAKIYLGKRRNEVPPHLWAIAETAYRYTHETV